MLRMIGTAALALGVVLTVNGMATAGDDGPAAYSSGTTMTLAGTGTAAQAATDDDTELAHYYRSRYYGGYRGYYGGYPGYYGGCGYSGYGYGYRPYYSAYYYRPYYRPYYPIYYGGYDYGCYYGISGTEADASAPVVSLALNAMTNPVATREPAPPAGAGFGGGFRYDGGPTNPVPLPKWEPRPSTQATSPATGLPVSLTKTKPTSPYTYKAYGEK